MNQARLRELMDYNPETGDFTWKETRGPAKKGATAGSPCNKGYIVIGIEGKVYKAHRLAWLYMTGDWPTDQLDHRNRDKGDNRWANLREASNQENCLNRTRYNRTGYRGVAKTPYGRFVGACTYRGKRYQKGGFATAQEASKWAEQKRQELFGDFTTP